MKANKGNKNEEGFKLLGLKDFFDNKDDKNINWSEYFDLKKRETFYAINANQIIEDDKNEDQIWSKYL